MDKLYFFLFIILLVSCQNNENDSKSSPFISNRYQQENITRKTPIMGWASWNSFRVNINEEIIKSQAGFMVSSGMKEAGYTFINIDDGYFGGRD
jgi:alpha-galactosidase